MKIIVFNDQFYENHLRYAVILCNYKTSRFIIAIQDTEDYPIVILREYDGNPFWGTDYYTFYDKALTYSQAEEILEQLKKGDTRKARTLLKRYFREDDPYWANIEQYMLDDMIPDDWYDAWKKMEWFITSEKDITGYWETDITEELL